MKKTFLNFIFGPDKVFDLAPTIVIQDEKSGFRSSLLKINY